MVVAGLLASYLQHIIKNIKVRIKKTFSNE